MRLRFSRAALLLAGVLAASLVLAGCGSDNGPSNNASVRSLNLFLPNTPPAPIQFTQAGTNFGPTVAYGTNNVFPASGYVAVTPGALSPSVTLAGQTTMGSFTLAQNGYYSLVAAGSEAGIGGAMAPVVYVIPGYNTTVYQQSIGGSVAVRVINLSPDADSVGFGLFTTPSGGGTEVPVVESLRSVTYGYNGAAVGNQFVVVPTSSLTNLRLVETGDASETLVLASPSNLTTAVLRPGHAYTLWIYGSDETGSAAPLTAVWVEDTIAAWQAP